MNLVTLHAGDDVLEGLGLHAGLLKLAFYLFGLLVVCLDEMMHLLPLFDCYLILMTQEVDVSLLETHAGQFTTAMLGHPVVIFANRVQVLRDYSSFVQLACGAHLAQLALVVKVFLGAVEPATALH